MAAPTQLHKNWGTLSYSYDQKKKMHRASIKYSTQFLDIAMNDKRGYLPTEYKKAVRYYGSVASKDKSAFDKKVRSMISSFNASAIKMDRTIWDFGCTDIAMLDREDIHSYHYEENERTQRKYLERMRLDAVCVLCKVEADRTMKIRDLKHRMRSNKGVAFLVLNLMPPIGFATWSSAAIDYVLQEDD